MTFTYAGTLATDLDKVRFYLQDSVENAGPKPNDGNFTDAELSGLITVEGTWGRAVAAGFEALAAAWRRHTTFTADGLTVQYSDVAEGYDEAALTWRRRYGGVVGEGATRAGSRAVTRVDGYSDDEPSHEVS